MAIDVDRKLVKWGSGYGIRLTAAELAALGLHAGAMVHATLAAPNKVHNDFSKLALFKFKQPYDVKKILRESFGEGE